MTWRCVVGCHGLRRLWRRVLVRKAGLSAWEPFSALAGWAIGRTGVIQRPSATGGDRDDAEHASLIEVATRLREAVLDATATLDRLLTRMRLALPETRESLRRLDDGQGRKQ